MKNAPGAPILHAHVQVSTYAERFAPPAFDPPWPRYDARGRLADDSPTEPLAEHAFLVRELDGLYGAHALRHPEARAAARTHADPRLLAALVARGETAAEMLARVRRDFPRVRFAVAQPVRLENHAIHTWSWRLLPNTDLLLGVARLAARADGTVAHTVVYLLGCGCDWDALIRS